MAAKLKKPALVLYKIQNPRVVQALKALIPELDHLPGWEVEVLWETFLARNGYNAQLDVAQPWFDEFKSWLEENFFAE